MNYETDVRLVDAHTKGYGRHDDLDLIRHPLVLDLLFPLSLNICMVEGSFYFCFLQDLCQFLTLFFGKTINDSRLILVLVTNVDDVLRQVGCLRTHTIEQVWTVKTRLEVVAVGNAEFLYCICLHLLSCRSCEGQQGSVRKLLLEVAQVGIVFTEIPPPGRDAVNLIYNDTAQ